MHNSPMRYCAYWFHPRAWSKTALTAPKSNSFSRSIPARSARISSVSFKPDVNKRAKSARLSLRATIYLLSDVLLHSQEAYRHVLDGYEVIRLTMSRFDFAR